MPSATSADSLKINIAIIGGGISGLSAAIAISALPHVSVRLFERGPELREYGAGISIAENSWKVLEWVLQTASRELQRCQVPTSMLYITSQLVTFILLVDRLVSMGVIN